jgi:hypothetical protein
MGLLLLRQYVIYDHSTVCHLIKHGNEEPGSENAPSSSTSLQGFYPH